MPTPARPLRLPAFLLGFALSGFLDGILLHQILQWHHLLSAIRGENLRFQVLADGVFHLAMYAVAAVGLWLLWRRRGALGAAGAARALAAFGLLGFGAWHLADAVLSHWVLGIHRIRWDAANPLAWDLGWLLAFGVVPLALGWALHGRGPGRGGGVPPIAALLLGLGVAGAGVWASRPPPGQALTTIVFAPGVAPGDALAAALRAGDAFFWSDGHGVLVVSGVTARDVPGLHARGALLVTGAATTPGCFDWRAGG